MTRVGLVLGKFAPLHRGHQFLIEQARSQVERLYVLMYESPEIAGVPPLDVRAGWVRQLYSDVHILEGWGAPADTGPEREIQRLQERYIASMLPEPVTHFFSSEWYGAHVSAALGAIDVRVDGARTVMPVSATAIRADLEAQRQFLDPVVYADLVKRVVFLGAESTGKTTLSEACAHHFETTWTPEYGREFWEEHHDEQGRLSPTQLIELARTHLVREQQQAALARGVLFVDTNAMTTELFCRQYHDHCPAELNQLSEACSRRYAAMFLCDTDIPYVEDGTRSGQAIRTRQQRRYRDLLMARGVPYHTLRGSLEERVQRVAAVLQLAWPRAGQ